MPSPWPYQLLADAVLIAHFVLVIFVVGGLPLIVAGNLLGWRWVNGLWFRLAHLATIATVVAGSWLGVACPLTTLESWLRTRAGAAPYRGSFIAHWLQRLLFYEGPEWAFALMYSVFALLVAAAWVRFPPNGREARRQSAASTSDRRRESP